MLLSSRPLLDTRADRSYYVDRPAESAALDRALAAGLNTLVLGRRGSGKTSFLRYAAARLRERDPHDSPDSSSARRVEVLDAGLAGDAEGLLTLVADRLLGGAVNGDGGRLLPLVDRLRRELPGPAMVLLDNASAGAVHVLFGRLRDEMWSLPVVWVVTADEAAAAAYLEPPADAFFESRVVLGPLDEDSALQLLRCRLAGGRLDAQVSDDLLRRIVRGVPERTPRHLVTALREVVGSGTLPTAAEVESATEQQRDLAKRLSSLGRSASMLVAELQTRGGSASASDDGLLDALGWTRSRATQVFRQLETAELVTSSERRVNGAGRPRKVYELVGRLP